MLQKFKNILPFKIAIKTLLGMLCLVLAFHLLVITQIIPYEIVWGGKLNSINEMLAFEALSIILNGALLLVILMKGDYIKSKFSNTILNSILWAFIVIFSFNTLGNLFAKTSFETLLFTPLTFISAILCFRTYLGNT